MHRGHFVEQNMHNLLVAEPAHEAESARKSGVWLWGCAA